MAENDLLTTRVLVALDPAVPSGSVLDVIASLTAGSVAELLGLFVEDINLLRLAELPFACEVSYASGGLRRIDSSTMERQLRARATEVRRRFEEAARARSLRHSFQITRGEVVPEVQRAARDADLLVVSRSHRRAGLRSWFGATIYRVALPAAGTVVIVQEDWRTGSRVVAVTDPGGDYPEVFETAARIASSEGLGVTIAETTPPGERTEHLGTPIPPGVERISLERLSSGEVALIVKQQNARVLVLPRDHPDVSEELVRELLDTVDCSLVLAGRKPTAQ